MMGWWDHGGGWTYAVMWFGMMAFSALAVWAIITLGRSGSRLANRAGVGWSGGLTRLGVDLDAEETTKSTTTTAGPPTSTSHHRLGAPGRAADSAGTADPWMVPAKVSSVGGAPGATPDPRHR